MASTRKGVRIRARIGRRGTGRGCGRGAARPMAFATDVRRTITGNLKRFISLFVITALGATMLVGLKAACDDLRATADGYYDAQRLFDISIQSTLGLTKDDVDALSGLDGVEVAEGGYTETAYTEVDGGRQKVDLRALSPEGLNEPRVVEGRLPRDTHEVAVTQKYLDASGKRIGDTVTFEGLEDEDAAASGESAEQEHAPDAQSDSSVESGAADDAAPDGQSSVAGDAASTAIFTRGEYTITGSVLDPMDVNAGSKTMSFRATSGAAYAFFFTPGAVIDRGTFTIAYLTVAGASALSGYSEEYDDLIDEVKQRAEGIREAREAARTDGVKGEVLATLDDAEAEADEQLAEAEGELADAQSQIDAALAQVASGEEQLAQQGASAEQQLAAAQAQLDDAGHQLEDGLATIDAKQAELNAGRMQAESALAQVSQAEASADTLAALMGDAWPADAWTRLQAGDASAREPFVSAVRAYVQQASGQLSEVRALCDSIDGLLGRFADDEDARRELLEALDRLAALLKLVYPDYADDIEQVREIVAAYVGDAAAVEEARATVQRVASALAELGGQLDALGANADGLATAVLSKPQVTAALEQIEAGQVQLDAARAEAQRGLGALDAAREQLSQQRASAEEQLAAGTQQLQEGAAQAASGQAELDEGRVELDRQRTDAEARFADARAEVDGIEGARWYIQDRSSLPSYASVESDASSIESIATVFPFIFFTVAVLISLTTVTRMVEEDRGLIGLYKALGYSRGCILSKYLIYSFAACMAGGIAGDILGFIALPEVIFTIFTTMYALPAYQLGFNALTAVAGIALFAVGIVGATFVACRHALRETPASLMRPKAPRAGKRILLERITPLWRRMGFLNKVSARNLFRYKKRFLMTVFGIAGCTALMICGLGIRDTVISLKPRQYGPEGIVKYDLMAVTADDDFEAGRRELEGTGEVEQMLEARIDSVTVEFNGIKESVQIMVLPDNADLSPYMKTDNEAGEHLDLPREGAGALITKNAEQVLGFALGDELAVQDSTMRTGTVRVDGVSVNYLGNFIFMTESAYREAFGEAPAPNAFLANLAGVDEEKIALADELSAGSTFVSVSSSTKIANDFSEAFKIVDVVVYVVTVMAAALAFAVVFTLSNTNISERERELATIKVLGFRRREVYHYINKETIVLTLIGIVAGFPLGYAITRFLTYVLRMPSLFFDTLVDPMTYLFAAVMSLTFTLVINQMTNRSLDRIVMVEALKSTE